MLFVASFVVESLADSDAPKLGRDANSQETARHLGELRSLLSPPVKKIVEHPPTWKPAPLDSRTAENARIAFSILLPAELDAVLAECAKAEREWKNERIEVYGPDANGQQVLLGFDAAKIHFRTAFTRAALRQIGELADIPADRRMAVFKHLPKFPELIAVIQQRPWAHELEAYLEPQLFREIDRVSGWRGTTRAWIACLLEMNTPLSWKAVEQLLCEANISVRLEVYRTLCSQPKVGFDLRNCMLRAWSSLVRETRANERLQFAPAAAGQGVTDALVELAEAILRSWEKKPNEQVADALIGLLEESFPSPEKAAEFVVRNRKSLVFEPQAQRFRRQR
ncbi:MAG: hypothetical protein HZA93_16125 [Verrucomicrobia bacterium]|nr:hypothetical protein [Verrucomicrobiota bacterium]